MSRDWDDESEDVSSESGFEDEASSDEEESDDGSVSDSSSEEPEDENASADQSFTGSEDGSQSDDESEEGSEEESESESGSEEEYSDDSDESYEDDSSEEEDPFVDEELGSMKRGMSSGNLMNEPSSKNPSWTKYVPRPIANMGKWVAATYCLCLFLIPLLCIIIPLAIVFSRDKADPTPAPTIAPSMSPTIPPTLPPTIRAVTFDSDADTTIYRTGSQSETPNGDQTTMLVQNGPPGDDELPSAYSLVQFEGNLDIGYSTSVESYLSSVVGLTADLCLNVAVAPESNEALTYSTCLLRASLDSESVKGLTGATADYTIPDDCVNGAVVTFDVDSATTSVCVDVAGILTSVEVTEVPPAPLRGLRNLEEVPTSEVDYTYVFMIDTFEESDKPGTQFFTSSDTEGRSPTLSIEGNNTCRTTVDVLCSSPEFSTVCAFGNQIGMKEFFLGQENSTTIFAPVNDAFTKLDIGFTASMNITETLLYHVADELFMAEDLGCTSTIEMANGDSITTLCGIGGKFFIAPSGVSSGVNSFPEILTTDTETCDGVIHAVSELLVPDESDGNTTCVSEETLSIAELACTLEQDKFSILCGLLQQIGFTDLLSGGLFTVFAPTNDALNAAFDTLSQSGLDIDVTDPGLISQILMQHIIPGSVIPKSELPCGKDIQMANGAYNSITCDDDFILVAGPGNDPSAIAGIDVSDQNACNGIIHIIGNVIIPSLTPETPVMVSDDYADGEFAPCGICGKGLTITNGDAQIDVPDSVGLFAQAPSINCAMAERLCLQGSCGSETCSAFADGISEPCGCVESNSIVDALLASPNEYSTLLSLAVEADLVSTLAKEESITLFAPTNDAFDSLDVFENLKSSEWQPHLEDVLLYHLLSTEVTSSDVSDGLVARTQNEEDITFSVNGDRVFVNEDSELIAVDTQADNGVIHTINSVLLPSWVSNDLATLIGQIPELSSLNAFGSQAGIADVLGSEGPYTVFAPSNDAVAGLLQQDLELVELDIPSVLSYHIVPGVYTASDISDGLVLTSVLGEELVFSVVQGTTTVNGERITSADALANNGVLHVIDGILMPPKTSSSGPGGAETQSCSICSGTRDTFVLNNPEAMMTIPSSMSIPNIREAQVSCKVLEETCVAGFCSPEICTTFAFSGAKTTCGCEAA